MRRVLQPYRDPLVLRLADIPPEAAELRRWRKQAGLTQAQLATLAGLTPRCYTRMERGKRLATPDELARIRAALAR